MVTAPASQPEAAIELEIGGMTCASCANRIERKLNKLPGVTATVNYATEKAKVTTTSGDLDPTTLIATVEQAGYTAALPTARTSDGAEGGDQRTRPDSELAALRQRLWVSVVLTVPVIALAMVPAWQFTYWQWASLTLAAPVIVWGAWPFHKAAWTNLRHGTATMDTLVSVGTLAALAWSIYALFWGTAGQPGMTHGFELTVSPSDGAGNIYLEVAAGVTMFILAAATSKNAPNAKPEPHSAPYSNSEPKTSLSYAAAPKPASPSPNYTWTMSSWCGPERRSPPTASSPPDAPPSMRAC